jgi:hypothetical protein
MTHHYAGCSPCCEVGDCECGVTSVTVTFNGEITVGFGCDCEDDPSLWAKATLTASAVAIVCTQEVGAFGCPYRGEVQLSVPITDCEDGATAHTLKLTLSATVIAATLPSRGTWKVSLSVRMFVDFSSYSRCGFGDTGIMNAVYVAATGPTTCPPYETYALDSLWSTCLPAPDSGPFCQFVGGLPASPFIFDLDPGSVTVS